MLFQSLDQSLSSSGYYGTLCRVPSGGCHRKPKCSDEMLLHVFESCLDLACFTLLTSRSCVVWCFRRGGAPGAVRNSAIRTLTNSFPAFDSLKKIFYEELVDRPSRFFHALKILSFLLYFTKKKSQKDGVGGFTYKAILDLSTALHRILTKLTQRVDVRVLPWR